MQGLLTLVDPVNNWLTYKVNSKFMSYRVICTKGDCKARVHCKLLTRPIPSVRQQLFSFCSKQ